MPTYVFHTEETVPHEHRLDIELPVDMGDSSTRLTDRMARTVAENRAIDGVTVNEKVVAVWRDDKQIWPRKHKPKTIAEVGHPVFSMPPEEEE